MSRGKGGGRPPVKMSDEEVAQIEALAAVCTKAQIADYFGITEKTLRAIEDRQPEVFTALKRGKSKAIANVARTLLRQGLEDGNTAALIFYLKTQAGWSEKLQVEADVNADVNLMIGGRTLNADELGW